jgi:hypothetical protein
MLQPAIDPSEKFVLAIDILYKISIVLVIEPRF